MTTLTRLAVIAALSALSFYGCAQKHDVVKPSTSPAPQITISIQNLKFIPQNIQVTPGTIIHWTNRDPVDHDITSGVSINGRKARGLKKTRLPDGKFSSGLFGKNKGFTVTLSKPGEYPYYCSVHPFMTGKIIVK